MSAHKDVVERYFDGFHRSDHGQILACLTEDVVWDLPGSRTWRARRPSTARSRTPSSRAAPR
jgi:ketosteroid isomerase-like protein